MKIYFKSTKSYGNLWNTMKVLRGQETSLESSKGFYRVTGLLLTTPYSDIGDNPCKSEV